MAPLPREFPPRSTVTAISAASGRDQVDDPGHPAHAGPGAVGPEAPPTAGLVESHCAGPPNRRRARLRPGKKLSGRKRDRRIDTLGLPLRLVVHPATSRTRRPGLVCARVQRRFPGCSTCSPIRLSSEIAWMLQGESRLPLEIVRRPRDPAGFHLLQRRLGDRAYVRLARPQSPARQRLRTADRYNNRHGRARHHPDVYPQTRQALDQPPELLGGNQCRPSRRGRRALPPALTCCTAPAPAPPRPLSRPRPACRAGPPWRRRKLARRSGLRG